MEDNTILQIERCCYYSRYRVRATTTAVTASKTRKKIALAELRLEEIKPFISHISIFYIITIWKYKTIAGPFKLEASKWKAIRRNWTPSGYCLRYLTVDWLNRVRELARMNKCMHLSSLIQMTVRIENLHRVTELDLGLYRYSKIPPCHYLGYRSWLFCMLTGQSEGWLV